jgi:hypothetical protein
MVDFKKEPVAPKPVDKPTDGYVYTGEKNYEAPKPDPWIEESK